MMGLVYDDWQKEALSYDGDRLLLCTGRQVGKTMILSRKSAEFMVSHPKSRIIVVSLTEDQAKLIIVFILDYLEKKHPRLVARGRNKPTQSKVVLTNGSSVISRPVGNTGDAVRGFTGDVLVIDEASRMPESAFVAAKPTLLTTGGRLWMSSTPRGKRGYFWECYNSGRWHVIHKSSEDVIKSRPINSLWTDERREGALALLSEQRKEMSELQYGQEYLGLFLDDLRVFFPEELINKCCVLERPKPPVPKVHNFLGVDIARFGGDAITYEIINRRDGKKLRHVESIVKKNQPLNVTESEIIRHSMFWECEAVGIDAGSGALGVGIYDNLLENPLTKRKVVAMNNREISLDREGKRTQRIMKEDMYNHMLALMERGELLLLKDPSVMLSLRSVQWEVAKGDMKKQIISKIRIFGNDTHIVEGLVRAVWLARKQKINKLWITYV